MGGGWGAFNGCAISPQALCAPCKGGQARWQGEENKGHTSIELRRCELERRDPAHLAGGLAGTMALAVVYPLDFTSIRMAADLRGTPPRMFDELRAASKGGDPRAW
eukprot:355368-Chlamydomonas_euryale.AAC.18